MWHRSRGVGEGAGSVPLRAVASDGRSAAAPRASATSIASGRRAYYRVAGMLPIRVTPIAACAVDAEIFDLSMPDPLLQPIVDAEGQEDAPLMARLRRIEEKLDLLLGASPVAAPQQLSGRDRRSVVFSGSGLALDVSEPFRRGDAFKVEILLPPPYSRMLRAVAEAVRDAAPGDDGVTQLPLALLHMEDEDRDALVAYSYDLQRFELRSRHVGGREA